VVRLNSSPRLHNISAWASAGNVGSSGASQDWFAAVQTALHLQNCTQVTKHDGSIYCDGKETPGAQTSPHVLLTLGQNWVNIEMKTLHFWLSGVYEISLSFFGFFCFFSLYVFSIPVFLTSSSWLGGCPVFSCKGWLTRYRCTSFSPWMGNQSACMFLMFVRSSKNLSSVQWSSFTLAIFLHMPLPPPPPLCGILFC
jgi:uncharacterized Zn-finger protein